jgi:hypothetical protein
LQYTKKPGQQVALIVLVLQVARFETMTMNVMVSKRATQKKTKMMRAICHLGLISYIKKIKPP